MARPIPESVFHFVLIKPSHYDDDGYPLRWWRSVVPSNTLATMNGLLEDCIERQVLGPDVEIRTHVMDETNTRIRPERIIRDIRAAGGRALIGFVGVQTNQFPRAVDLAQPFLAADFPVIIGGFHVSGCLAMLPELPEDIRAAQDMGISMFAGEAEDNRLDEVLHDAWNGTLKPLYDHMNDLPGLEGQPIPFLDRDVLLRGQAGFTSFDLGRGCPYQCSFCTIINVQGRKSRFRSADDLEKIIRRNAAQGVNKFFVTDDDLVRNKHWEEFFDRLIWLKEHEKLDVRLTIQVDTQCHKVPGFIKKACRAGVERVFMGMENINPDNLIHVGKRHNKITEYRKMMQEWREYGTTLCAGCIIGFPGDTKESVLRDVEIIKKELPVDVLEFFNLTPLPGSADHQRLSAEGVWMDPDMNKYDTFHHVTKHEKMSDREWAETYRAAWHAYYTPEHIETVGRRAVAGPVKGPDVFELFDFYLAFRVEDVHPLEGGVLRLKSRRDRRPGLPLVNPLIFYPAFALETARKAILYAWYYSRARRMHKRIHANPDKQAYRDLAITPPTEDEHDSLALFQETAGGKAAVRRSDVQKGKKTRKAELPEDVPQLH